MKKIISLALVFVSVVSLIPQNFSSAAIASWNAGKIIDDAVFTNAYSMPVGAIQKFLESKVPVCDTYGQQRSELGGPDLNGDGVVQRWEYGKASYNQTTFTCLRNAIVGGKSASQIIYDTAVKYQINPQVFIALLQKEQGLVTDTWPLDLQYRSATGYGCPDTAPCDAQYYGLINQLDWSGKMFRAIMDNSPTWYTPYILGNNFIRYNVPESCGGSTVNIQNRATQALYNYTPYQPSAASLAAGYGTGDGCSSHGNRNFWLYFNDWFGGTVNQTGVQPASTTAYSKLPCTIPAYATSQVGRLYNPDTQDYLFTTNSAEACGAVKVGYIWDGVMLKNEGDLGELTKAIYRLRRGSSHVYTASLTERNTMVADGYVSEGIAFYGYATSDPSRLPVYFLGQYDTRVMTSAGAEGTTFVGSLGYKSFGVGFYTSMVPTQSTLYRLRNGADRFYTVSATEAASAVSSYKYTHESTTQMVDSMPGEYSTPVYRLNSDSGRLYTTSRAERDLAVINYGYKSEGVGFYSYTENAPGVSPVYRSTNYAQKSRLYTQSLPESFNSQTYYGYKCEGVSWYGL
ncbi:hypothetical protein LCH21_02850 [Patescibacteria group bacterium]|nr:hypothetical protein [Patescibacteria group bacterium]